MCCSLRPEAPALGVVRQGSTIAGLARRQAFDAADDVFDFCPDRRTQAHAQPHGHGISTLQLHRDLFMLTIHVLLTCYWALAWPGPVSKQLA